MNSLPGNLNTSMANQLSKKAVQDQRMLAADTAKGQLTTATTLGASTTKAHSEVKVDTPKEKVTLSHLATPEKPAAQAKETPASTVAEPTVQPEAFASSTVQPEAVANSTVQPEASTAATPSKSGEALMAFTDTLFGLQEGNKEELQEIITQSASIDTSALPAGESGREVALAATALRTAVAKLQAKMPNATPEQIREAAKNDPEIAKWAAIADSANTYLHEVKAESPQATAQAAAAQGAASPAAEGGAAAGGVAPAKELDPNQNPFRLNPEQQAQMMADNVKTMQQIMNIYQQMWAEISKARAQRHQIMMETANAINGMMMETHINRMKSSDNHRKAVMAVILEQTR